VERKKENREEESPEKRIRKRKKNKLSRHKERGIGDVRFKNSDRRGRRGPRKGETELYNGGEESRGTDSPISELTKLQMSRERRAS